MNSHLSVIIISGLYLFLFCRKMSFISLSFFFYSPATARQFLFCYPKLQSINVRGWLVSMEINPHPSKQEDIIGCDTRTRLENITAASKAKVFWQEH